MNYSEILKEIENASSFDLFRLSVALERMLEEPSRIISVKQKLIVGQEIGYFEPSENRVIKAKVIDFKRTKVSIENIHDKKRWVIPYYFINTENIDTTISENKVGLGRNEVKVGDLVGFIDRSNQEKYGCIVRLNQKTVTLEIENAQWRVAYQLLFKIISPEMESLNID
ncbi:MAG: hypothetical protein ACC707_06975 [Thiohalomonadales bacterium]